MIAFPGKDRREIVAIYQNNVYQYNLARKSATVALKDIAFSPNAVTCGHGYLAVGGQRSQVIIRQLGSNWVAQTAVGGAINNSLLLHKHQNDQVRLLVCNNDQSLKVFSVPNMNLLSTLSFSHAVNNVGVSPDGSLMAVVGDSSQVLVHSITSSGEYKRIGALTAVKDAAFSCSWDSSSTRFAVACQDGYVCVWDIRHLGRKLAQIPSFQRSQKGACRVVKFSQTNSVDLLVFSEHTTYFNIVDARAFDVQQSVRVAPAGVDLHLSGLAFSPDSDSVFVGVEQGILEYPIDLMSRRCFPTGSLI